MRRRRAHPGTRPAPAKSHPRPRRTAQEPPKSHPRPLRTAQEPPKSAQDGFRGAQEAPRRPREGSQKAKKRRCSYENAGLQRFRGKSSLAAKSGPRAPKRARRPNPEKIEVWTPGGPWSPTGTRPEGKGQEGTRADKTNGRTRQQADKRKFSCDQKFV